MSQNYGAEYVKCPFYREETKNTLKCEGEFSETCTFTFQHRQNKNLHKAKYCKTEYCKCPHFLKVRKKYP